MTNGQITVIQIEHLADALLKMNKVSLSLQGKQLTVFVANDRIWEFRRKLDSWTLTSAFEINSSPILEDFSHEMSGDTDKRDVEFGVLKCVNVGKSCLAYRITRFQKTNEQ